MAKLVKDINIEKSNSRKYLNAFKDMGKALKTIFSTEKEVESEEDIETQVIEMEKMSSKRIAELEKFIQRGEQEPSSKNKKLEKRISYPRSNNRKKGQIQERVSGDDELIR